MIMIDIVSCNPNGLLLRIIGESLSALFREVWNAALRVYGIVHR